MRLPSEMMHLVKDTLQTLHVENDAYAEKDKAGVIMCFSPKYT